MNVIGITGKKRSGKDASANILSKVYGYQTIAFADALKESMIGVPLRGVNVAHRELYIPQGKSDNRDLDLKIGIYDAYKYIQEVMQKLNINISYECIMNVLEKYDFYSFRVLMQVIGTDLIHPIDNLFWVNKTFSVIDSKVKTVIITDVRFMHEYNAIKEKNGIVLKILKDTKTDDKHISENLEIPYDVLVENNGTLIELEEKLCQLKLWN